MKSASPSNWSRGGSVRPIDTLLAIKVLNLIHGLNASERRVATVLIEHYNRKSGRCDPGLRRIAELMNSSTRTVIRANHKLERMGLFRKVRHGGYGNRNSYEPIWGRFAEFEVAWNARLKEAGQSRATRAAPSQCHPCQAPGDGAVAQTCNINLLKTETYSKRPARKEFSFLFENPQPLSGTRSADAARAEAERRWCADLNDKYSATPEIYAEIISAVDVEMQKAATEAEMRKHGAGLRFIYEQLKHCAINRGAKPNAAALRQNGIVLNRSEKKS